MTFVTDHERAGGDDARLIRLEPGATCTDGPLAYLGPEGTFTHAAARTWLASGGSGADVGPGADIGPAKADVQLLPMRTAADVVAGIDVGTATLGVIPIENTVEGVVVPSLDALLSATNTAAFAEVVLPITFDVFVLADSMREADAGQAGDHPVTRVGYDELPGLSECNESALLAGASEEVSALQAGALEESSSPFAGASEEVSSPFAGAAEVSAHPHALAQAARFIAKHGLHEVPASSNAAACRDLQPGQVALGPPGCGPSYGLKTVATNVGDYPDALTRFLVLTRRDWLAERCCYVGANWAESAVGDDDLVAQRRLIDAATMLAWRTMLAVYPREKGPGVLARICNAFGGLGVNMSSLVTRPIKARAGEYVFIVTFDAAPWEQAAKAAVRYLLAAGDVLQTLGVYKAVGSPVGSGLTAEVSPASVASANQPRSTLANQPQTATSPSAVKGQPDTTPPTSHSSAAVAASDTSDELRRGLLW